MGTKFCKTCGRQVATVPRYSPNHVLWAVFTLLSCGLFAIPWLLAVLLAMVQGSKCQFCGK